MAGTSSTERKANLVSPLTPKEGKWGRLFVLSAGVMLFVTGAAKIASVLGKPAVLGKPDPLFGIQLGHLLLAVGSIELITAVFCLTSADKYLAMKIVAALSINFLSYRAGLWLIHWQGYCPCLGTITQAIHLSPHRADILSRVILVYLISGSLFFLAGSSGALKLKRAFRSNQGTRAASLDISG